MRGRGDRKITLVDVVAGVREWDRLKRLGGRAHERHERLVPRLGDDRTILDGHCVDAMDRLDNVPPMHGYPERLDAVEPKEPLSERWSLAPRRLHEAVGRAVDQRVRLTGLTARDPARRRRRPEGERLRGRVARDRGVSAVHPL